jgi:hypothetical protein
LIDNPNHQFGNSSAWTWPRTRSDGPKLFLTLMMTSSTNFNTKIGDELGPTSGWGDGMFMCGCGFPERSLIRLLRSKVVRYIICNFAQMISRVSISSENTLPAGVAQSSRVAVARQSEHSMLSSRTSHFGHGRSQPCPHIPVTSIQQFSSSCIQHSS